MEGSHIEVGEPARPLLIAIPLYPEFTALDAVGPYEVLHLLPNATVKFIAHKTGLCHADLGMLSLQATATFDEVQHPDVIVVPGGPGTFEALKDEIFLNWIKEGKIVTSAGVSSGIDMAIKLAALLQGEEMAKILQLCIEYDPQPPYDVGSASKAGEELVAKAKDLLNKILS